MLDWNNLKTNSQICRIYIYGKNSKKNIYLYKKIPNIYRMTFKHAYMYIYIYIYKFATVVEGDAKAAFQWLPYRDVGNGATPFFGFLLFTLNTYLIMLGVKQGGINTFFESFCWSANIGASIRRRPLFVLGYPEVPSICCSSYLDSFYEVRSRKYAGHCWKTRKNS